MGLTLAPMSVDNTSTTRNIKHVGGLEKGALELFSSDATEAASSQTERKDGSREVRPLPPQHVVALHQFGKLAEMESWALSISAQVSR